MNDTILIDQYIHGELAPGDKLVMDARTLLDSEMAAKVEWQKLTYAAIRQYSRKELREEIEQIHNTLFSQPRYQRFRMQIKKIFGT